MPGCNRNPGFNDEKRCQHSPIVDQGVEPLALPARSPNLNAYAPGTYVLQD
jgi:hypothetical protein